MFIYKLFVWPYWLLLSLSQINRQVSPLLLSVFPSHTLTSDFLWCLYFRCIFHPIFPFLSPATIPLDPQATNFTIASIIGNIPCFLLLALAFWDLHIHANINKTERVLSAAFCNVELDVQPCPEWAAPPTIPYKVFITCFQARMEVKVGIT